MPLRAALYARVSLDDDRQSPESQLLQLREFAAAKGWAVVLERSDRAGRCLAAHRLGEALQYAVVEGGFRLRDVEHLAIGRATLREDVGQIVLDFLRPHVTLGDC